MQGAETLPGLCPSHRIKEQGVVLLRENFRCDGIGITTGCRGFTDTGRRSSTVTAAVVMLWALAPSYLAV